MAESFLSFVVVWDEHRATSARALDQVVKVQKTVTGFHSVATMSWFLPNILREGVKVIITLQSSCAWTRPCADRDLIILFSSRPPVLAAYWKAAPAGRSLSTHSKTAISAEPTQFLCLSVAMSRSCMTRLREILFLLTNTLESCW